MAGLAPVVRYLLPCEEVILDPTNPARATLENLITFIEGADGSVFPLYLAQMCVYLQLRGCRGPGEGRIQVVFADTEALIFATPTRLLPFGADPLELVSVTFRITDCPFPQAGMYNVQFWYNGKVLAQEYVIVR
jgi:hypothetical protein